jgi:hypothetical protein
MILSQQFPKLRCIPRSAVPNPFSQEGFTMSTAEDTKTVFDAYLSRRLTT